MQLSMFSSGERPASRSASPDSARASTIRAVLSCSRMEQLLAAIAPAGWFGRTCPASCRLTEDGILEPSSGCWASSGMGSPTAFWTLSTSAWPSDARVCSLSAILETGDHLLRYCLSAKACAGILRRAEKRGKEVARPIAGGSDGSGGYRNDADTADNLTTWPAPIAPTLNAAFGQKQGLEDQHVNGGAGCFVPVYATDGQANAAFAIDKAHALTSHHEQPYIAHALRGEGFDASEDGTGRGTPLAALSCKDHGADAGSIAPTLRAMGHDGSHANAGGQLAVAFALRGREGGAVPEIEGDGDSIGALRAADGGSSRDYVASFNHQSGGSRMQLGLKADMGQTVQRSQMQAAMIGSAVRRLTPRECERLQGFPDDYTLIPYRGGTMKDGPRYKMLGNSMAVPCMRWIGERIDLVSPLPQAAGNGG